MLTVLSNKEAQMIPKMYTLQIYYQVDVEYYECLPNTETLLKKQKINNECGLQANSLLAWCFAQKKFGGKISKS